MEDLPCVTIPIPPEVWNFYVNHKRKKNPRADIKGDLEHSGMWEHLLDKKRNGNGHALRSQPLSAVDVSAQPPPLATSAPSTPKNNINHGLGSSTQVLKQTWPTVGLVLLNLLDRAVNQGSNGYWDSRYTNPPKELYHDPFQTIGMLEKAIELAWDDIPEQWQKWILMAREMCRIWLDSGGK